MPHADVFTRLADGTTLLRQADGTFRPVKSETDHSVIAAFSDAEIEQMARTDADHPALDDAFWQTAEVVTEPAIKQTVSIKLDRDVLTYFRQAGRGYQTRINAILRRYMEASKVR